MLALIHIPGYSTLGWSTHSTLLSADLWHLGHCRPLEPGLVPGHLHCLQCRGTHTPKIILSSRGYSTYANFQALSYTNARLFYR